MVELTKRFPHSQIGSLQPEVLGRGTLEWGSLGSFWFSSVFPQENVQTLSMAHTAQCYPIALTSFCIPTMPDRVSLSANISVKLSCYELRQILETLYFFISGWGNGEKKRLSFSEHLPLQNYRHSSQIWMYIRGPWKALWNQRLLGVTWVWLIVLRWGLTIYISN